MFLGAEVAELFRHGEGQLFLFIVVLILLLFLCFTGWIWNRLGNHGFLVRQLAFQLPPAQIIKLIIALHPRWSFVLHRSALIKSSTEPCSLLFHSELGSVAHIAS